MQRRLQYRLLQQHHVVDGGERRQIVLPAGVGLLVYVPRQDFERAPIQSIRRLTIASRVQHAVDGVAP